jgi:hypothetical protein
MSELNLPTPAAQNEQWSPSGMILTSLIAGVVAFFVATIVISFLVIVSVGVPRSWFS